MLRRLIAVAVAAWCGMTAVLAQAAGADTPLPFGRHEEMGAQVAPGAPGALHVKFTPGQADAVVRLKPAEGTWNLEQAAAVLVDVGNRGAKPAALFGRFDNARWSTSLVVVPPGATGTLALYIKRDNAPKGFGYRYPHMLGRPGGVMWLWSMPDPAKIGELTFLPAGDQPAEDIELANLRVRPWNVAVGKAVGPLDDSIFPFVDAYGQYMHRDWPGKIHTDADLTAARDAEQADLKANPGPADWDTYGGWAKGPTLKATGHFRTEKVDGRWWLVDPDGRLFWSQGIDCIGMAITTSTKNREHFYAGLSPDVVRAGYWNNLDDVIAKKYGGDRGKYDDLAHVRLRSWGMNTVGNWSDDNICLKQRHRTPYVLSAYYGAPKLPNGFPDAANPGFRKGLADALDGLARRGIDKDPYCLGIFIDNELRPWTGEDKAIEAYFAVCREEMRRALPNKLYLGCRFDFHYFPAEGPKLPVQLAAKYCDVVSFNRYQFGAADLRLPEGAEDKPILIGEFHFGALDRGPLHTGLVGVSTQNDRAAAYQMYVRSALHNPAVVGAHWFQYGDQPVTGRFDGENYQVGFVDICDTPYPETIAACRQVGQNQYQLRTTP